MISGLIRPLLPMNGLMQLVLRSRLVLDVLFVQTMDVHGVIILLILKHHSVLLELRILVLQLLIIKKIQHVVQFVDPLTNAQEEELAYVMKPVPVMQNTGQLIVTASLAQ